MPRPTKRRQVETATHSTITGYARVSKANLLAAQNSKKDVVVDLESSIITPTKKRKASAIRDTEEHHPRLTHRTVSFPPSGDEGEDGAGEAVTPKRTCRRSQEPRISTTQSSSPVAAPAKGKKIARVNHQSRTAENAHKPGTSTVISKARSSAGTKARNQGIQTTLDSSLVRRKGDTLQKKQAEPFPPALLDLLQLHKAFIKTILLHTAHSSRGNAPIDFCAIEPNISRNWGKRKVTVEDIQRCLAIQSSTPSGGKDEDACPLMVCDYGRGRICIEVTPSHVGTPINEERLYMQFEANLRHFCTARATEARCEDEMAIDVSLENLTLDSLPKADVTNMDTGVNANPMLAKGQRTLTAFKNDIVARQQEKQAKQAAAASNPMLNTDGSKMSLLDRLRLKQLLAKDEPLPASGPELERRAALNRVMDVSATVSMLSLASAMPRQSFPLAALVQRLKDSMRTPISDEEAARCVRLMATEVAPEWLRLVTFGGRDSVVVQKNLQPVDRVLRERVQGLIGH